MSDAIDLVEDIFVKSKKAKKAREATPEQSERAAKAVNAALEAHELMSYGRFWSYCTQKPCTEFRPSEIQFAISLANSAQDGADALLVNKGGRYGEKAPGDKHRVWLKEHGYADSKVKSTRG